jgi:cytochrome c
MSFIARLSAALLCIVLAAPALAADDAAKGAIVFQRCAMCHDADKGGGNGLGPNLFGVVGRKVASLPDFPYSSALKASRIVWTDDKLKVWIAGPAKLVPGTRMAFGGLKDPRQIDDLIAFLHTRK